jgi:initiation factor 1A
MNLFFHFYILSRMVKNTTGGSKAKGFARKNEQQQYSSKLRMVEQDGEQYAVVRKIFGGSRCEVFCQDNTTRQAIIRGKFTGRNKRRNVIQSGTVLLVGIRDWVTIKEGKTEECDVLEVYSALEVDQLKQRPSFPREFLDNTLRVITGSANMSVDEFMFSSVEEPVCVAEITDTSHVDLMETGEEIDIDDI